MMDLYNRNGYGAPAMSDQLAGLDDVSDCISATKPWVISVEEAGQILGIGRMAAYQAVWRGQIPSIRIGRRLLVPLAKLNEMVPPLESDPHDASGEAA
jgi:excisionase family DNA binding protein